jgi:hypothetical protein
LAKDEELQTKREGVTFEEDPEEFCKQIYAEAYTRQKDLRQINIDNRMFYEGTDKTLEERANSKTVERSSLFVHELNPAINTRVSDVASRVEEREYPITVRPASDVYSDREYDQTLWIEQQLNQQLRKCGYLSEGFKDHILAAEIYRSPAAVKVGWEERTEQIPVVKTRAFGLFKRVRWESKQVGSPYVELLSPDEFLYQPGIANLQRDSDYVGHVVWWPWHKLMKEARANDWDLKKLRKLKLELEADDAEQSGDKTHEEEIQQERGTPLDNSYKDGKVSVVEWYIPILNNDGDEEIRQVIYVADKYIVSNRIFRGIRFPFVCVTANRMPGSIEGLSSIDLGKKLQVLYNECVNSFLDGASYRIFSPLVRESGTIIKKTPKWEPGAIFDVSNADGLRPLIPNPGPMPDLPSIMQAVSAKLRETLNAPDISQGFQSSQYEKATATAYRSQGAAKRSMPINKQYGMVLKEVAEMVLKLDQQHHPKAEMFVADVKIDVPSLTSISDPEAEKQEALLILTQAMTLPFYQSPTGMIKLLYLWEDVMRKFKKNDIEKFVPTEEELTQQIEAQSNAALAQVKKQNVMEEIAMSQAQEQSNAVPV